MTVKFNITGKIHNYGNITHTKMYYISWGYSTFWKKSLSLEKTALCTLSHKCQSN